MLNYSFKNQCIFHTTPGDDWSSGDDCVPRSCWWRIKARLSIPPAPPPANLPITSSGFSPHWGQDTHGEPQIQSGDFLHLPAWAWCSRLPGTAWWRSAETRWTSSGVCVWQNGKPRRKNVPSDSSRSQKLSSVGLWSSCVRRAQQIHTYVHAHTTNDRFDV